MGGEEGGEGVDKLPCAGVVSDSLPSHPTLPMPLFSLLPFPHLGYWCGLLTVTMLTTFVIRDASVDAHEATTAACYRRELFLTKSTCVPEPKLTPAPGPYLFLASECRRRQGLGESMSP